MPIKKQEFYEGAALHQLARSGKATAIRYDAPFFVLNHQLLVYLKYSTKGRSPWGFTFTPDEQALLGTMATDAAIVIGLVCGSDGVAAVRYGEYASIAAIRTTAIHLSCYRDHREHYEVNGPDGQLREKVAPSDWLRILNH
ncbi:MAG TPA: hypothetical protein VM165_05980 [Planctomycetaceae bacterium]|nr:hypothetical protein [Planctomycetaceae bacterium]